MAAKYKIFMNCSKNFIDIGKIQIWLPNEEYIRDHRCEGTNMAYKCKILWLPPNIFMGISILYRCTCV